ncbi:MAG: IS3 family transposase [Bacteroidales bacterium]
MWKAFFSLLEKEVIRRFELESLYHARDVLERYFNWHNLKKRRHALGKISPADYWHTDIP